MTTIGIDLGTTNSLVAYMSADGPVVIENELGDKLTPSAVAIADDGAVLVGRAAKDRLVTAPGSGRAFFKRDMGTTTRYDFGKKSWTPTELSALVLREMRRVAQARLGEDPTRAVITVPAYFHDPERQATVEAAKLAGLDVAAILNEPTAAALAFGYRAGPELRRLLVFDIGGGTFDVTVLEVYEGVIEVKASGGDSRLGGEDYTDVVLGLFGTKLGSKLSKADLEKLRPMAEVAKRRLGVATETTVEIAGRALSVSRREFETGCAAITAKLRPVVARCLRDAGIQAAELDDVLLVGGASRMPLIHELVGATFGRIGNGLVDPDLVVALGAAVRAAQTDGHDAVRELILTDVCAHSLGIETSRELAPGHREAGYYTPILDRNVPVPVSRSEPIQTIHPEQDLIVLGIYQGESRRVSENTKLGELRIPGLRSRPGQRHPGEIEVRFTYDANGLLEVDVTVLETGKVYSKLIESRPGMLSPAQRDEALRRLAPLKAHPRNMLVNRARLERASRAYAELTGDARDVLSNAMDRFEGALHAQDVEAIGFTAAALDQLLSGLFKGEDERQLDDQRQRELDEFERHRLQPPADEPPSPSP